VKRGYQIAVSVTVFVLAATGVSWATKQPLPKSQIPPSVAKQLANLAPSCPRATVDLGTWCLMSAPYSPLPYEAGKTDYFFASQKCVSLGGYLPSAAQLIGAANKVPLESVITDSPASATVENDPTTAIKDQREMSGTLVTTAGGSDAAGSEGVSAGATGTPGSGEPNPVPQPAVPQPQTLQYVTVYDNFNHGGFAGSEPVAAPENFRCAFDKVAGGNKRLAQ
jgi:hypothetical protein